MAFSINNGAQSSEINVTPLIDVLLVLLIIFTVLVPVPPRGLESSIPQGQPSGASLPAVTVQVVKHSPELAAQYLVNQRVVPSSELESTLRSLFAVRADHTLIVQADRELGYEPVAAVVSLGHSAGAGQIALTAMPIR
jgi:biopolymer transport protein TolR